MSIAFVTIPTGTMSAADILANFALLRTWVCGGAAAADITAATVRAQHIFRPDSFGFPVHAQHRATAAETAARAKAWDSIDMRAAIARIDLLPEAAYYDGAVRILPDMGITLEHWTPTSVAVVNASWSAIAISAVSPFTTLWYQGYFQLRYRNRGTGVITTITNSRRQVQSTAIPPETGIQYSTQASFVMTTGVWDIWLEWVPMTPGNDDEQNTRAVIIGLNSFTVRTHRSA